MTENANNGFYMPVAPAYAGGYGNGFGGFGGDWGWIVLLLLCAGGGWGGFGDGDGRYSEDNFRYSPNRGGSYNYSGMNSRHSMVDTLEQMAQAAVDEHERRVLMDCMNKLK